MNPRLLELLLQQRASRFADMAGARASAMVPVSDRLVTELLLAQLPANGPVREIDVRARDGNRCIVRVRLTKPALLPPIAVDIAIERQPELPAFPMLGLHVGGFGGFFGLAGPVARFFNVLPPWVSLHGQRVTIDLRGLLAEQQLLDVLEYLEHLEVRTEEGRFVISFRAGIPEAGAPAEVNA